MKPAAPFDPEHWSGISSIAVDVVTILAILLGGGWAFMKFVWGRTFRERLELAVAGDMRDLGDRGYLRIVMQVKNVGLAQVPLTQEGSGLRVFASTDDSTGDSGVKEPFWNRLTTVPVLNGHEWIEPGESIIDHAMLLLPNHGDSPCMLQLHLASRKHSWVARCVVLPEPDGKGALR